MRLLLIALATLLSGCVTSNMPRFFFFFGWFFPFNLLLLLARLLATRQQPVVCCFVTNLLSSNALHVSSTSSQAEENPKWLHAALWPSFLLAVIKKHTDTHTHCNGGEKKKVGG